MKPLNEIKALRVLVKPYKDWKKKRNHERYLHTPDHFYLKTLKGIHRGKRCFIIGNGPSLLASDLEKLQGEYTFAANRIFRIFDHTDWRPTYYLSVDEKVLKETQDELANWDLGHLFLRYDKTNITGPVNKITKICHERLVFYTKHPGVYNPVTYISEDVSDHFCDGTTVTFGAIQLAIYMGFNEIYLLGVDHNYSRTYDLSGNVQVHNTIDDYFYRRKLDRKTSYPGNLHNSQFAYSIAKEYCDTHGIRICNATRGGKLEVFERVDFDELMKGN